MRAFTNAAQKRIIFGREIRMRITTAILLIFVVGFVVRFRHDELQKVKDRKVGSKRKVAELVST